MKLMSDIYLNRSVDRRMVDLISDCLPPCRRLLDLGCGSGLYGCYLKNRCETLIGMDFDPALCAKARETGSYDSVIEGDVRSVGSLVETVDSIFCSEVLEHLTQDECLEVVHQMETICRFRIVITVPNPLSPHFRLDPTHRLKYSVFSLLHWLNSGSSFSYRLLPLGFSETNLKRPVFRILNVLAKRLAPASPTVLYVGDRKLGGQTPLSGRA